ncbi:hypothetical protein QAD02_013546 [Eretmocerus hayati]|uniref:Uncharacterized protein n=1 Tax=Eretmocerus hayati TaxID=131215 RepID=A0ACC2P361_9HYME|nr:hypothetical protein QAD02_013546 [Eretmocerus hayati]
MPATHLIESYLMDTVTHDSFDYSEDLPDISAVKLNFIFGIIDDDYATVSNVAKPDLDHAFRKSFTSILLPGMEKALQNMFKQVQDAFVVVTREYLENVDTVMDKQYQKQNKL